MSKWIINLDNYIALNSDFVESIYIEEKSDSDFRFVIKAVSKNYEIIIDRTQNEKDAKSLLEDICRLMSDPNSNSLS